MSVFLKHLDGNQRCLFCRFPSSTSSKAIKNKKEDVNLAQPDLGEPMLDSDDHHSSLSKP